MNELQLRPLAHLLLSAYPDVADYAQHFTATHGRPPTVMAKSHHFRSIVQAKLVAGEAYLLGAAFAEFGRVEIEDRAAERTYLLRSQAAALADKRHRSSALALFDAAQFITSPTTILLYEFSKAGLSLSVAGSKRRRGRRTQRLEISGTPTLIHTWDFPRPTSAVFEDAEDDRFNDVGGLDGETGEMQ